MPTHHAAEATDADSSTNQRKIEHVRIAAGHDHVDRDQRHFDAIRLTHRALPEQNLDQIDPSCELLGKTLSFPLLISGMTGGQHESTRMINRHLAQAARQTGTGLCVGSQRVMFSHPGARDSFDLRPLAGDALLMANLGAIQLNHGFHAEHCREAIRLLHADALYLHLNPLQEAVQPEGNTSFQGLTQKIADLVPRLDVPIMIKEVGCGISREDALALRDAGIRHIDIAGAGGTSWSYIEHLRHAEHTRSPGFTFSDWGIPTPLNLRLLRDIPGLTLIASGGIRTGIDMAKAIILGAHACAMALPLLAPAMHSAEAVVEHIERLRREFRTALFLLGVESTSRLRNRTSLLLEDPLSLANGPAAAPTCQIDHRRQHHGRESQFIDEGDQVHG